jgi:hypothetical protein
VTRGLAKFDRGVGELGLAGELHPAKAGGGALVPQEPAKFALLLGGHPQAMPIGRRFGAPGLQELRYFLGRGDVRAPGLLILLGCLRRERVQLFEQGSRVLARDP